MNCILKKTCSVVVPTYIYFTFTLTCLYACFRKCLGRLCPSGFTIHLLFVMLHTTQCGKMNGAVIPVSLTSSISCISKQLLLPQVAYLNECHYNKYIEAHFSVPLSIVAPKNFWLTAK